MGTNPITLHFDKRKFARLAKTIPVEMARETERALDRHGFAFERELARRRFDGGDDRLEIRTGRLLRSAGHRVRGKGTLDKLALRAFIGGGVASKYARIQEYGGVVRGRPWLTVPLPDNKTVGGDVRFKSAARLRVNKPGKTFLVRSKSGNLVIGYKPNKNAEVKWLWVLRRSVKLKPRLGFVKTIRSAAMRADRIRRFKAAMNRAMQAAARESGRG